MVVFSNGVDIVMGTSLLTGPLLLRVLLLMGLHLLMQIHLGMVILLQNLTTLTIGVSSQSSTLWQGEAATNNPCPEGYKVPSEAELEAERLSWSPITNAGYRNYSTGTLGDVGSSGYYWSSTVSGANARYLYFDSSSANMYSTYRADGYSVRCIKE